MQQNGSTKPTPTNLKTEPLSIRWDDGTHSSIRTPLGFREAIDQFLSDFELETGVNISRNQFILNGARFYLRWLLQSKSKEDLTSRMKEKFKMLDEKEEGSNVEP